MTSSPIAGPVEHVLYRLYAADGTLLYIGICQADRWTVRMAEHERDVRKQSWWPLVTRVTLERGLPSEQAARHAEREAIWAEQPLHNVQHMGGVRVPFTTRIEIGLHDQLRAFMVAEDMTMQAVLEAAVMRYMNVRGYTEEVHAERQRMLAAERE